MLRIYLLRVGPLEPAELIKEEPYEGMTGARLTRLGISNVQRVGDALARSALRPRKIFYAPKVAAWEAQRILNHSLHCYSAHTVHSSTEEIDEQRPGETAAEFTGRMQEFAKNFRSIYREGIFIFAVAEQVFGALPLAWYGGSLPAPLPMEDEYLRILADETVPA